MGRPLQRGPRRKGRQTPCERLSGEIRPRRRKCLYKRARRSAEHGSRTGAGDRTSCERAKGKRRRYRRSRYASALERLCTRHPAAGPRASASEGGTGTFDTGDSQLGADGRGEVGRDTRPAQCPRNVQLRRFCICHGAGERRRNAVSKAVEVGLGRDPVRHNAYGDAQARQAEGHFPVF